MKKTILLAVLFAMVFFTNAQIYNEEDKEGLRVFLAQPSAIEGETNGERLGLTPEDMQLWYDNEEWVSKVAGIIWYGDPTLRISRVSLSGDFVHNFKVAGELDATKWEKLVFLNCEGNELVGLRVNSKEENLDIKCGGNKLTYLDISGCTNLNTLECYTNKLTNLNLSGFSFLWKLICYNNQLTTLDLSGCPNLEDLDCINNPLKTLDLSGNTKLKYLRCWNNSLTNLDVSGCTKLMNLQCNDNQLSQLYINTNESFFLLDCSNNQLSVLEGIENTGLQGITCYNNKLKLSSLFYFSERIDNFINKKLGSQILLPQSVVIGEEIDFSTEAVLGGVETVFIVKKDGENAVINEDYTITNGIITFYTEGNYTIKMTNDVIISHTDYPAEVIAKFECKSSGIFNNEQEQTLSCYVQNGILYISGLNNGENWSVYNISGVKVAESGISTSFNVNDVCVMLPCKGVYIVQSGKKSVKVVY